MYCHSEAPSIVMNLHRTISMVLCISRGPLKILVPKLAERNHNIKSWKFMPVLFMDCYRSALSLEYAS